VLISDRLSRLEWFLLDLLEGFIRLPVRLIERRQCVTEVRATLESYSWNALIVNISDAGMGSNAIGSSHVEGWLRWVASLMGYSIRPEDFRDFDTFLSTLLKRRDALSKFIVEKLEPQTRKNIEDWERLRSSEKNELKRVMLFQLNTLIKKTDLRDHHATKQLRTKSKRQRSVRKESTHFFTGAELKAENIKILKANYSAFFHNRPPLSSKKVYLLLNSSQEQDIHKLKEFGFSQDRCFVIGEEDAHLRLAAVLWRDLKRAPNSVKTDVFEPILHKVLRSISESSKFEFEDTQRTATTLNSGSLLNSTNLCEFEFSDVDLNRIREQHYIAVVADDAAFTFRETENITLTLIRKICSQVGRSPLQLRANQTHKASWLLCDHDIAIFINSSRGEPVSLPASKSLRTRRYLLQIGDVAPTSPTLSAKPAVSGDIFPVAHWGAEPYFSGLDNSNSNLGRSGDAPGYESTKSVPQHSYPIVQLLLRDFKTIKREYSVWRRIGSWVDVIPRSFDEARQYMMIAPLEKELREILDHPKVGYWESLELSPRHRDMIYEVFIIDESNQLQPCLVGCINVAGRLPAGLFAYRQIARWHPRHILLYGIAGSLTDGKPQKGDLVIAERIVDYEYGKVSNGKFESRPQTYTCSLFSEANACLQSFELDRYGEGWPLDVEDSLRGWAINVIEDADKHFSREAMLEELRNEDNFTKDIGGSERERVNAKLDKRRPFGDVISGTVATGDKVVADNRFRNELVNKILKSHRYGLKAVEMEGAGVAAAIECFPHAIRPGFVMIRGICDDATPNKNDVWQPIAAKISAAATIDFFLWHKRKR
jgi:nucleoside phosphorylase